MNKIVTVEEAATFLHKHPGTIRRWIEEKKLKARHLSTGRQGSYGNNEKGRKKTGDMGQETGRGEYFDIY